MYGDGDEPVTVDQYDLVILLECFEDLTDEQSRARWCEGVSRGYPDFYEAIKRLRSIAGLEER